MKSLFLNKNDKRLKAGWRILLFLLIFWTLASLIFIIKPLFGNIGKREFLQDYSLLIVAILAASATTATLIARRFLDKKSFVSLGLKISKQTVKDVLFGFLLSGLMAGLFFVVLLLFNLIEFNGLGLSNSALVGAEPSSFVQLMKTVTVGSLSLLLLEHVLVGYWEELAFRGYLLQNMVEGLGFKVAVVLSCLVYGLIHAANPNAGILSSVIIVLFGFLRIYGYTLTKMLWLSMGMHIGWNFFQGPIFGFAASGHRKASVIDITIISNNDWLTGGEFGPEGSVLIIPIIFLALFAMRVYSKRQVKVVSL